MRDSYLRFRCSEEDKAMIELNAKREGMTVSNYLIFLAHKNDLSITPEVMAEKVGIINCVPKSINLLGLDLHTRTYKLDTNLGYVILRVVSSDGSTNSIIDFYPDGMEFNRTPSTPIPYK